MQWQQRRQRLRCPYCGASISILVDPSVPAQDYIEDCQVCCRPIALAVLVDDDTVHVSARRGDD